MLAAAAAEDEACDEAGEAADLGSIPRSLGSIPVKAFGSAAAAICFGSIHLGSKPRDCSTFGSMPASILGSYMEAISFGSIKAAIVFGSIIESIFGSRLWRSFGSTPGNILGSRPAKVVLVFAFELLEDLELPLLEDLLSLDDSALTMLGSNPRLLSAFSSSPWSIFGSSPNNLGSRPPVDEGIDIVVDVALVGVVNEDVSE